ncbi:TetR/AcrR family transcriptional regulator [Diaphorobacter caeni]|uniref:TetR/AcrR family transcriptional regulator n=1 Tax=Diaphorobacter caeni TaxID=2784387 RepID=UPI00188EA375|nr:TetR/AcrR family transcriptional regulator [Diaphorobacter caeni]MBF5003232.1 TetR/AcrR family transcriptional regulator [Diaphorobacter caeni]
MRYPASETAQKRERILDEAARLFRERGFDRVGVAEIMQAAGLTHGAFYAHFSSKEALASEALSRAFAHSERRLFRKRHADDDLKQRFVERYLNRAHLNDPGDGCPLVSLAPEVARSDALQDSFTEALETMIERMTESFDWTDEHAREHSITLLSTAVGALTLARAVNRPQLANELLNTVKSQLLAQPD